EGSLTVVEPSAGGRWRDEKSDRLNHRLDDSMHSGWPGRSSSRTGRATAKRPGSTETRRNTRPGKDSFHPGRDQADSGGPMASSEEGSIREGSAGTLRVSAQRPHWSHVQPGPQGTHRLLHEP